MIASYQSKIEDPNTSVEERGGLKYGIQLWESDIQDNKLRIDRCEKEIKQIENKGESII